jgi:hypothetical protein
MVGGKMLFGEEEDWKELLSGRVQVELAELIEKAKLHRAAYTQADDVKVAQLWAALVELSLELKKTQDKLTKMEFLARGFKELGETAKREAIKERVSDLFRPKSVSEKEEVDKIVDTLMQF